MRARESHRAPRRGRLRAGHGPPRAAAGRAGRGRDALLGQSCEALPAIDANAAAHLALGGGALVEDGAPADVLGRALAGPLARALADAGRVIDAVAAMAEVEVSTTTTTRASTTTATRSS